MLIDIPTLWYHTIFAVEEIALTKLRDVRSEKMYLQSIEMEQRLSFKN
jgi:hypothetical protein